MKIVSNGTKVRGVGHWHLSEMTPAGRKQLKREIARRRRRDSKKIGE